MFSCILLGGEASSRREETKDTDASTAKGLSSIYSFLFNFNFLFVVALLHVKICNMNLVFMQKEILLYQSLHCSQSQL